MNIKTYEHAIKINKKEDYMQEFYLAYKLVKTHNDLNETKWVEEKMEKDVFGICVGFRTLYNGKIKESYDTYEGYCTYFSPEESIHVALMIYDPYKNPIYVAIKE